MARGAAVAGDFTPIGRTSGAAERTAASASVSVVAGWGENAPVIRSEFGKVAEEPPGRALATASVRCGAAGSGRA